jgi:group I intron endonuclease
MIYRSLLKNGYSVFSFEILEYCDADKAISREQYFIELLKPEYNILKIAGSLLGFKHSEETLAKFQGRNLTANQKAKLSEHLKNLNNSQKAKEHLKKLISLKSHKVEILDTLTNETRVYSSVSEAGRAIASAETVRRALKVYEEKGISKLIRERYTVKPFQGD